MVNDVAEIFIFAREMIEINWNFREGEREREKKEIFGLHSLSLIETTTFLDLKSLSI